MIWLPLIIFACILTFVVWWDYTHPLVIYRSEDDPRWQLPDVHEKPMPKGWVDEARELHEVEEAARAMAEFEQTMHRAISQSNNNGHGEGDGR